MKKFLVILLSLGAILWFSVRIFSYYNERNILSSQAAFEVYLDIDKEDIDNYFRLKDGTYDKDKHIIICELPLKHVDAFKPRNATVNFTTKGINCNEEYIKGKHTKYDRAELDGNKFRFMIVKRSQLPVAITDYTGGIGYSSVIGAISLRFDFTWGEINRIVFAPGETYNYCKTQ